MIVLGLAGILASIALIVRGLWRVLTGRFETELPAVEIPVVRSHDSREYRDAIDMRRPISVVEQRHNIDDLWADRRALDRGYELAASTLDQLRKEQT